MLTPFTMAFVLITTLFIIPGHVWAGDSVHVAVDTLHAAIEDDTSTVTLVRGQRVAWLSSADDHYVCDYNGQHVLVPRMSGVLYKNGKALTTSASATTTPASSSGSSTSTQCTGTTKSGNRCKRMTTSSNGRCWQH